MCTSLLTNSMANQHHRLSKQVSVKGDEKNICVKETCKIPEIYG